MDGQSEHVGLFPELCKAVCRNSVTLIKVKRQISTHKIIYIFFFQQQYPLGQQSHSFCLGLMSSHDLLVPLIYDFAQCFLISKSIWNFNVAMSRFLSTFR